MIAMSRVNDQKFTMLHICDNISSSIHCKNIISILLIRFALYIVHQENMFQPSGSFVIIGTARRVDKSIFFV